MDKHEFLMNQNWVLLMTKDCFQKHNLICFLFNKGSLPISNQKLIHYHLKF